ncbi:MAG: hypothetical protein L3J86_04530, partial [Thermoplasmata archaeon]|nr:hypothetical protein [Thermoplasmata archaeon]
HPNGEWDAPTTASFDKFLHENNFENKARTDRTIWPSVLDYLQTRAADETERRSKTAPTVPNALERGPGGGAPSKTTKSTRKPTS